ncbi:MAG: hypothetical protein KAJ58_00770 [Candidatus Pacebacteria bacterium]|nr:hypothetical protein [Candidatus Paceibacterota bacterium]
MISKKEIERIIEYKLLGLKALGAFVVVLFQSSIFFIFYFIIDISLSFYQKYQGDKNQDLSNEEVTTIKKTATKTQKTLDKLARDQKEYNMEEVRRKESLSLLNKLLTESEVREKDLLSLTSTSEYYQLFVYSASLSRLVKSLDIPDFGTQPNRLYPIFLKDLGFARLGKGSPSLLINKNNLKEKKLTDIKEFKKFLMYHFSKVRGKEWKDFIEKVKSFDKNKSQKLKKINYRDMGYLKINFLLTETNMNITNVGLVDGEHLGLGSVKNDEDINRQILLRTNIKSESDKEDLKIRIRKVINKQDISFLLNGISKKIKLKIESEQDTIKENLNIKTVLGFSTINESDLKKELVRVGLNEKESKSVSNKIISRTQEYQLALDNLQINIE